MDYTDLEVDRQTEERAGHWARHSRLASQLPRIVLLALMHWLYEFQLKFLFDDAPSRTLTSSRQVGKSHILSLGSVLGASTHEGRSQYLISKTQRQANHLLRKCKAHVRALSDLLGRDLLNRGEANNSECITLWNDNEIRSLPGTPDSARGYTGDFWGDEAAFMGSGDEMAKAALGIATQTGYRKTLASTPRGDTGFFHDYARGPLGKNWSHHTVTIYDAHAQGFPVEPDTIKGEVSEPMFEQEYLCQFLSDAASWFPRHILDRGQLRWREVAAQLLAAGADVESLKGPLYGGIDIGRRRDLSGLAWMRDIMGTAWQPEIVDARGKVPYAEQEQWFSDAIVARSPRRLYVDRTGIGDQLAETLERAHPSIVYGQRFDVALKLKLAETTRVRIEQGRLGLHPDDEDTLRELYSIRRKVTKLGNVSYQVDESDDGHADRATALMLAVVAWDDCESRPGFFEVAGTPETPEATMRAWGIEPPKTAAEKKKYAQESPFARAVGALVSKHKPLDNDGWDTV